MCDRCRQECIFTMMSRFNTQMICATCEDKERAHPKFDEAVAAELDACKRGDFNFPGIGLPADL